MWPVWRRCTTYVLVYSQQRYATPLLQLAKDKDTQIIPSKEAEAIFSNVGDILAANKMMLVELEVEYEQGPQQLASVVGDILLRNVRGRPTY